MPLERTAACALVEAGYMPLRDYIEMFGDEVRAAATRARTDLVRLRPWQAPAHFERPFQPQYRVTIQRTKRRK